MSEQLRTQTLPDQFKRLSLSLVRRTEGETAAGFIDTRSRETLEALNEMYILTKNLTPQMLEELVLSLQGFTQEQQGVIYQQISQRRSVESGVDSVEISSEATTVMNSALVKVIEELARAYPSWDYEMLADVLIEFVTDEAINALAHIESSRKD